MKETFTRNDECFYLILSLSLCFYLICIDIVNHVVEDCEFNSIIANCRPEFFIDDNINRSLPIPRGSRSELRRRNVVLSIEIEENKELRIRVESLTFIDLNNESLLQVLLEHFLFFLLADLIHVQVHAIGCPFDVSVDRESHTELHFHDGHELIERTFSNRAHLHVLLDDCADSFGSVFRDELCHRHVRSTKRNGFVLLHAVELEFYVAFLQEG